MLSLLYIIFAYLVGAIPSGYIFSKLFFGVDITKHGSGNIGATNVARVLGVIYFAPIFILDFFKAFLVLYLAQFFGTDLQLVSVALLLGNAYSIFLNFGGGKGVSTAVAIILYLFSIKIIFVFLLTLGILFYFIKRVDFSALSAILLSAIIATYLGESLFIWFIVAWVFWRHKGNIYEF